MKTLIKRASILIFLITIAVLSIRSVQTQASSESYLFGSQLTGLSKLIYNHLVDAYVSASTDNIEIDLSEYEYDAGLVDEAYNSAISAYSYDFPYSNYMNSFSWHFLYMSNTNYVTSITGSCTLNPYFDSVKEYRNYAYAENTAVNEVLESIPADCDTRYKVISYINSYLVNSVDYDSSAAQDMSNKTNGYAWSAYGALIKKTAVCEGYAKAFKYCCDKLGIPCVYVVGISNGGRHAWNYVQMENDYWYGVDVTFNDPVFSGTPSDEQLADVADDYLLIGKSALMKDHSPQINGSLSYPKLSAKNYNPENEEKESFSIYYGYAHEKLIGIEDNYKQVPCLKMYKEAITAGSKYKIELGGISDNATITYKSSAKSVARVTTKGIINTKKKGTTTITITIKQDGRKYRLKTKLTVLPADE